MTCDGRVAVVTGGSSGIGLEVVKKLTADGYRVYEFSRRESSAPRHISVDVTNDENVISAFSQVIETEGGIDILVCCAGFGISGACELTPSSEALRQLDVNLLGAARCVNAVLPSMREAQHGHIVLVSSVAAVIPIPFQAWYSASKAAINSYVSALRNEISPFGIKACAVMPGDASTGFTDARHKMPVNDAYAGRVEKSVAVMEHDERSGMSAASVAALVAKAAYKANPAPFYTAGAKYKVFVFLLRLLPDRLVNFIIGKMYGG